MYELGAPAVVRNTCFSDVSDPSGFLWTSQTSLSTTVGAARVDADLESHADGVAGRARGDVD